MLSTLCPFLPVLEKKPQNPLSLNRSDASWKTSDPLSIGSLRMFSVFKLPLRSSSAGDQSAVQAAEGSFFLHGAAESVPRNPRVSCDFTRGGLFTFLNCILEG